MAQYIEIVDDTEIIPYRFVNPDTRQVTDSLFNLRVISPDQQRVFRKQFTRIEFRRANRTEEFDWSGFADACLDYGIVGWSGVRMRGEELPCERAYKIRLPEIVKTEIMRLTLGRELGDLRAELEGQAGSDPTLDGAEPVAEGEQRVPPSESPTTRSHPFGRG